MKKDWRLEQLEAQPHLRGVAFLRKPYHPPSPEWDHDHCAACWTTLAAPRIIGVNIIHEGYTTTSEFVCGADYAWICVPCFELFHAIMEWRDATAAVSG
ncbi:MAG TPA: hypothetical protein VIV34_12755 [Pseudolabrys sp.]